MIKQLAVSLFLAPVLALLPSILNNGAFTRSSNANIKNTFSESSLFASKFTFVMQQGSGPRPSRPPSRNGPYGGSSGGRTSAPRGRGGGPGRGSSSPSVDVPAFTLSNPQELVRLPAREPRREGGEVRDRTGGASSYTPRERGDRPSSSGGSFSRDRDSGSLPPSQNEQISRFSREPEEFVRGRAGYTIPPELDRKGTPSRREPRKSGADVDESREVGRKSAGRGEKTRRGTQNWAGDDDTITSSRGGASRRSKRGKGSSQYPRVQKIELPVQITSATITVADLASAMDSKPAEVVKYLMINMGIMATITQSVDAETAVAVAEAFGKKVVRHVIENGDEVDAAAEAIASSGTAIDEDPPESLRPRPPVVTIMGHVDHGKTSLLDAIRSTKVASGEAGGITQAIGAYQVLTNTNQEVTFIDTPGHAAFSEMRARGANATDVVVLVVAADDGVKEQTIECIATAKMAGVPIVVAINKMDKPGADPARVLNDLMNYGLLSSEFGGDVEVGKISAKKKEGLDDLLEKILLQAEVLELKANPNRAAQGIVIEAGMRQGLGAVTTTLIQRGTLKIGDIFVAGASWGKVKILMDHTGAKVSTAGPSMPVQVVGIEGVPSAGDVFMVVDKEDTARIITESRRKLLRESQASQMQGDLKGNIEAMFSGVVLEGQKEKIELPIVLRADGPGSAEALTSSLKELVSEDEYFSVSCKILASGVGEITKSDIAIAGVSNAYVICFNVGANNQATEDARRADISIGYFNVVYDVLDTVAAKLDMIRSPKPEGTYIGRAQVKAIFNIGKVGNIAGCTVLDGEVRKGAKIRVMRLGRVVNEGKLKVLKNMKADAETMVAGTECGIQLTSYEDFQTGDFIECYIDE